MAAQALSPHPEDPAGPVDSLIAAGASDSADATMFRFALLGDISAIRLPDRGAGERRDELWRTTCFEAFLAAPDGAYLELNFSPSTNWAAYEFDAYRQGMRDSDEISAVTISVEQSAGSYALTASVRFKDAMTRSSFAACRVGLTAVIEDIAGRKTYWAIAHPDAKPDFHHPDSFVYLLGDTLDL